MRGYLNRHSLVRMKKCKHFGEKIGTVETCGSLRSLFSCSVYGQCVPSIGPAGICQCWDCSKHSEGPQARSIPKTQAVVESAIQPCQEPVGDYLAQSFAWLGQVKGRGCGCDKLQAEMNSRGCAWCRLHAETILQRLQNEAFARNLPILSWMFKPALYLAIFRASRHAKAAEGD